MNNEIRKARLMQLVEDRFGGVQADAARGLGVTSQWLSDVLQDRRQFGERKARAVEEAAGLAAGWLDRERGRATGPDVIDVVVGGKVIATVPAGSAITLRVRKA